jgi:hypothetical protein
MEYITNHWADIVAIVTGLVTVASIIVKLTPNKYDDTVVAKIMQFLSLNKK